MSPDIVLTVTVFAGVASMIVFVALLTTKSTTAAKVGPEGASRPNIMQLRAKSVQGALPRIGAMMTPSTEAKSNRLRDQLVQAGLYRDHANLVYLGIKFLMMVVPLSVGVGLSTVGMLTLNEGILFGVLVGLVGNVLPGILLRSFKAGRQRNIRRAIPDALDVIVVCMEGGLSLPASFARVAVELKHAHPLLADEMSIVKRQVQMGHSTGDALRNLANRFDIEELRSLASVILQAERFGASLVKALRVHADALRIKRYQQAESKAQRAPVKLIFPTVLCIFPALYVVLMGPAGVQLLEMLNNLGN